MKYHPYTDIWPLLEGDDFEKLKADIAANGQRIAVVTYQDMVLDGRNRERACKAIDVPVRYSDASVKTDEEALALVVSLNEHRRHMSFEQRAFAAARLKNIIKGSNQFQEKIKGPSLLGPSISKPSSGSITVPFAAKTMNVTIGATEAASAILRYAGEAGAAEVISGKVALWSKRNAVLDDSNRARRRSPGELRPPKRSSTEKVMRLYDGPGPKYLTPQEVDPEFTGTPMQFTAKYGHVQIMTAEQYATIRFADWASFTRSLAKRAREMPELKQVDHNWLRSPKPNDVAKLTEALECLRPLISEAEALLERAVTALKAKQVKD